MKKEFAEAFDAVAMPQECERKIRAAMEKKQMQKSVRRLYPVAAAFAVVVLVLTFSTEVRAEVKEIVETYTGTSFFTSLRSRQVRRSGNISESDGKIRGIVIADKLNVRRDASYDSHIVASLRYGDRIEILEERDGWLNIREGWVCKEYIYEEGTVGARPGTGSVIRDQVNIRMGPGTDYEPVGVLDLGDQLDILEQIRLDNTDWGYAGSGWICMEYVELDE